jgi:hypothetical protein
MKHTHSQRKSILAWRRKLDAIAEDIDTGDANRDLRELHAFDIAMIEAGIVGLLATTKDAATREIVEEMLADILACKDDPAHWRNAERQTETREQPAPDNSQPREEC